MQKRKVWVEPLFAEAKDWHGLRRFRLRRLWRVNIEALMIAAGQNLKRLLRWRGWRRRPVSGMALPLADIAQTSLLSQLLFGPGGRRCRVREWLPSKLPYTRSHVAFFNTLRSYRTPLGPPAHAKGWTITRRRAPATR
jgi:hypothetical protein